MVSGYKKYNRKGLRVPKYEKRQKSKIVVRYAERKERNGARRQKPKIVYKRKRLYIVSATRRQPRKNKMKITDGKSDALELVQRIHVEMKILQKAVDELEYLIYSQDERAKIEFFKGKANDERRSNQIF